MRHGVNGCVLDAHQVSRPLANRAAGHKYDTYLRRQSEPGVRCKPTRTLGNMVETPFHISVIQHNDQSAKYSFPIVARKEISYRADHFASHVHIYMLSNW